MNETEASLSINQLPKLGVVRLAVNSLEQALLIWRDIVGLEVITSNGTRAKLGVGEAVLIELEATAFGPVQSGTTGLYHLALHVPRLRDLAIVAARASKNGIPYSTADYLITQACYLSDHDGNGIEVAFESPWRGRLNFDMATYEQAPAFDTDGNNWPWRQRIDPATLAGELGPSPDHSDTLPVGTRVGHVHLRVSDLETAMAFYAVIPGFNQQYFLPKMGFADFRTDYPYHIVALNNWDGPKSRLSPDVSAGLLSFSLVVSSAGQLETVAQRLASSGYDVTRHGEGIDTADPSGNRLRILHR